MKILCERQALVDAVSNVQRAVAAKSALPALEGILLRAFGNSLFLAGYDMELGITTTIEAEVSEPGEIVLTAKLFSEIIRKLPGKRYRSRVTRKIPPPSAAAIPNSASSVFRRKIIPNCPPSATGRPSPCRRICSKA